MILPDTTACELSGFTQLSYSSVVLVTYSQFGQSLVISGVQQPIIHSTSLPYIVWGHLLHWNYAIMHVVLSNKGTTWRFSGLTPVLQKPTIYPHNTVTFIFYCKTNSECKTTVVVVVCELLLILSKNLFETILLYFFFLHRYKMGYYTPLLLLTKPVILLLFCLSDVHGITQYYVKPTEFDNMSCPGEPCHTLNYFASNTHNM